MINSQLEYQSKPGLPKPDSLKIGNEQLNADGQDLNSQSFDVGLPQSAKDWTSVLSGRVSELDQSFRRFVKDNPIPAYLIALGAGIGISLLLRRRSGSEGGLRHDIY